MPPKKRARIDYSSFIDEEADVQEDSEEEELVAEEGYVSPTDTNAAEAQYYQPRTRLSEEYFEEMAARYEQQNREQPSSQVVYPEEEYATPRAFGKRPPRDTDPKLWLVRVRPGQEHMAAMQIIQRHFNIAADPTQPGPICSAISTPFSKGFIYIEAYQSSHILSAVRDLRSVLADSYNNKPVQVPLSEMMSVLRQRKEHVDIPIGAFVRVLRGVYKNDLARIHAWDAGSSKAVLELVPRFVYDKESRKHRLTSLNRPPPKLFDAVEASRNGLITDIKHDPYTGEDFQVCMGQRFNSAGFLLKTVNLTAFTFVPNVTPDLIFQNPHFGAALKEVSKTETSVADVEVNDLVRVVRGELKGITGTVLSLPREDIVVVLPRHADIKDPVEFTKGDLAKAFDMGNKVRILSGDLSNETGFVVALDDKDPTNVTVMTDVNRTEVKIATNHLKLEKAISFGQTTAGRYFVRDAVQINPTTVGMIVNIDAGKLVCLLSTGLVQTYAVADVHPFKSHASAMDSSQQPVKPGDHVSIQSGTYMNKSGRVLCIFRSWLFIDCPTVTENSGIIVIAARSVKNVTTAIGDDLPSGAPPPPSPLVSMSPIQPTRGIGQKRSMQRTARGVKTEQSLKGKQIKVVKGQFRGYKGTVQMATEMEITVQLPALRKSVRIPREYVKLEDEIAHAGPSSIRMRASPIEAPKTPITQHVYVEPESLPSMAPSPQFPPTPMGGTPMGGTPLIGYSPAHQPYVPTTPTPVHVPPTQPSFDWVREGIFVQHEGKTCVVKSVDKVEGKSILIPIEESKDSKEVFLHEDQSFTASNSDLSRLSPEKGHDVVIVESKEEPDLIGSAGILKTSYGEDVVIMLGGPSDLKIVNIADTARIYKPFFKKE
ncbi:hypothetical protein P9112_012475 [Eukaryota sp. TZLM1-RC]